MAPCIVPVYWAGTCRHYDTIHVLSVTQKTHTRTAAKHRLDTSYSSRAAAVAAVAAHRQSGAEQDLPRFRHALLIFLS